MSRISYCANVKNDIKTHLPKKKCCLKTFETSLGVFEDDMRSPKDVETLRDVCKCDNCVTELLKAVFVSYGSFSDPSKDLQLEFVSKNDWERDFISSFLEEIGFPPKCAGRRGLYVLYYKDGDIIEDIFAKMGLNSVVFDIINRKIRGEIRNAANRMVNSETANMQKSVSASAKYLVAIKELQKRGILKSLPPELYEAATLRSEFPDAPLSDLARRTSPPISKSGLLHRLDRILIIAENYKSKGDSQNNG